MEASSLRTAPGRAPLVAGAALLRLKGDEQLVTLVRRGHDGAFEVLFRRYQPRLLAFCRHMLGSTEDAEDVLQESFASAHRAMIADERPIVARAWLYRIARNRCLDHLRRPAKADGQDSMDVFERGCGVSSEDLAHQRAEIRDVMGDIRALPEAQRSALLMREIDTLSHEQIAAAMETTVSSVKSLLVRARISLTEAARARSLTCDEVRLSIAEVEEGIAKAPPEARRHLKACQSCQGFKRDFRRTTRVLGAVCPFGPFLVVKNLLSAKLGAAFVGGGPASSGGSGAAAATTAGAASGATAAAIAAKTAAAGVVAAAVAAGGAVELDRRVTVPDRREASAAIDKASVRRASAAAAAAAAAPTVKAEGIDAAVLSRSHAPAAGPTVLDTAASPVGSSPRSARRGRPGGLRARRLANRRGGREAVGQLTIARELEGRSEPDGGSRPRRAARAPADGPTADRSRRPADRPRRAVNLPRRAAAPRPRRASAQVPTDAPRTARRAPRLAPIDRRARPVTRPRRRALGSEGRRAPQPDAAT